MAFPSAAPPGVETDGKRRLYPLPLRTSEDQEEVSEAVAHATTASKGEIKDAQRVPERRAPMEEPETPRRRNAHCDLAGSTTATPTSSDPRVARSSTSRWWEWRPPAELARRHAMTPDGWANPHAPRSNPAVLPRSPRGAIRSRRLGLPPGDVEQATPIPRCRAPAATTVSTTKAWTPPSQATFTNPTRRSASRRTPNPGCGARPAPSIRWRARGDRSPPRGVR